ncbi:MAG: phosphoribosylanthranilate isomerase [Burkholderiaceae bacterium]|nr:phosphoribosylanthranilate isomerase [Sulfuritalea sp.]MCF8176316.1 phosphoribosylanthranilate isomerase [Burkholderiaceae bacterium]MCF8183926.1 phosphoribosylanthranilate isomerase [Polynucleobacter sp.]
MARTRIKICGITREEDLAVAVAAGADALGFVFYPPSPRHVEPERAAKLSAQVPAFVTTVGLFVNASPQAVRAILDRVSLNLLQFHGDEDADYCSAFGKPWIKAARVKPGFDLLKYAAAFADAPGFSGLLLDAHVEGYGGGGETFDWSLIPSSLPLPIILSGGLCPANVTQAVRAVRPWAVDVSSGVESAKGIKDALRITEFVAGVRDADAGSTL